MLLSGTAAAPTIPSVTPTRPKIAKICILSSFLMYVSEEKLQNYGKFVWLMGRMMIWTCVQNAFIVVKIKYVVKSALLNWWLTRSHEV